MDIAAGALIIKEAGRIVTELNLTGCQCQSHGQTFRLNGRSIVAAATETIHNEFIKVLNNKQQ